MFGPKCCVRFACDSSIRGFETRYEAQRLTHGYQLEGVSELGAFGGNPLKTKRLFARAGAGGRR